jgi:hypothetical protein
MDALIVKLKNKKTSVLRRSIEKQLESFRNKSAQEIPVYLRHELPDPKIHLLKQAIRSKGDKDIPPGSFFLESIKKAPRKQKRRRKKIEISTVARRGDDLSRRYKQLFAAGEIDLRPMSRISTSFSSAIHSCRNLSHSQNSIHPVKSNSRIKSNRLLDMSYMSTSSSKKTKDELISSVQKTIKKFNSRYYGFNKEERARP